MSTIIDRMAQVAYATPFQEPEEGFAPHLERQLKWEALSSSDDRVLVSGVALDQAAPLAGL